MGDIIRVTHRHGDQPHGAPDLILAVEEPLASSYGRHSGLVVKAISGTDLIRCVLSDGDITFVGPDKLV